MRTPALAAVAATLLLTAGCGGADGPQVGKCTNQDPDVTVQVVALEIVSCDDDDATQRIVRTSKQGGRDCESGRLTSKDGTGAWCTEPL